MMRQKNQQPYIAAVVASKNENMFILVMVEIQVIQHHEDEDQPQMIIIMALWSLTLATAFFKEFLSMEVYGIQ